MKWGSISRCLSSSTRMAIILGPKQRPVIRRLSPQGRSGVQQGQVEDCVCSKKGGAIRGPVDDSFNAPAASVQFLACETQGGAYRSQTERSLQYSIP
jgi:hypothetical protein